MSGKPCALLRKTMKNKENLLQVLKKSIIITMSVKIKQNYWKEI